VERVVPGLDEDVQREDGLQRRGGGERDPVGGAIGKPKTDAHLILFSVNELPAAGRDGIQSAIVDELSTGLTRMLQGLLLASCAIAVVALGLAFAYAPARMQETHVLVGLLVVGSNVAAYRLRTRLYELERRHGWAAVALSAVAGALLLVVDVDDHQRYVAALFVGVFVAVSVGRVGWALLAAALVSACYVAGLQLHGYPAFSSISAGDACLPLMVVAALGGAQRWFARFVNVPPAPAQPAAVLDAQAVRVRDRRPALAGGVERTRRGAVPQAPGPAISTLSVRERVARLSALQRDVYRREARGERLDGIAASVFVSHSTLFRERRKALEQAHARTHRQLAGWVVHVDALAADEGIEVAGREAG
jgi:hypothetical protein